MSNEEKIISMLEQLPKDVASLKVEVETKEERIARHLTALEGMRSVLTKEETEKLAEIVGI